MKPMQWNPWGDVTTLRNRINRMFDEAFHRSGWEDGETLPCDWHPVVDVYETDSSIVILAELPGVNKEGVFIEVKGDVLTLKGERRRDEKIPEASYYRRERRFGTFLRSFSLPALVEPESIKAAFKEGVLRIEVPKPAEQPPRQVDIL